MFVISALYLLYAEMEEKYGLARHSMEVYRRATQAVLPAEKLEVRERFLGKLGDARGQFVKYFIS